MFALDLAILTSCQKKIYKKPNIYPKRTRLALKKSVDLFVEKTVLQFNKGVFSGGRFN